MFKVVDGILLSVFPPQERTKKDGTKFTMFNGTVLVGKQVYAVTFADEMSKSDELSHISFDCYLRVYNGNVYLNELKN